MVHHRPRLHKGLDIAQANGLLVHSVCGGYHDEAQVGSHPLSLEIPGRDGQILQIPVGAGAQINLVDPSAQQLGDRVYIVHALGAGDLRLQVGNVIGQHLLVAVVLPRPYPGDLLQGHVVVRGGFLIALEKSALGPSLQRHVGDGEPSRHGHFPHGGAHKFQALVLAAVSFDVPQNL